MVGATEDWYCIGANGCGMVECTGGIMVGAAED